jgi:hypothetical protein
MSDHPQPVTASQVAAVPGQADPRLVTGHVAGLAARAACPGRPAPTPSVLAARLAPLGPAPDPAPRGPASGQGPVALGPVALGPVAAAPAAGPAVALSPAAVAPAAGPAALGPVAAAGPTGPAGPIGPAGPVPVPAGAHQPGGSRAVVRDDLREALAGTPLSGRDRQFLSRLVHWDKRNAASVVSLLRRARLAGRSEGALSPPHLQTVLAALQDAVVHRVSGVGTAGCWDCEKARGGRCADHARDFERARDYAELAALLSGERSPAPIQRLTGISGYRRRAPIVS